MTSTSQDFGSLLDSFNAVSVAGTTSQSIQWFLDALTVIHENAEQLNTHDLIYTTGKFKISTAATGILDLEIEVSDEAEENALLLRVYLEISLDISAKRILFVNKESIILNINHKNLINDHEENFIDYTSGSVRFNDNGEKLLSYFLNSSTWVKSLSNLVFH